MAQLNDLPAEIVDCIISYVRKQNDVHPGKNGLCACCVHREIEKSRRTSLSTLLNLCLTSKKMRTLAEPHLYQIWQPFQSTDDSWTDDHQRSLQDFLSAIILRPELANHVQQIGAFDWRIKSSGEDDNLLQGDDEELFNEAAEDIDMPDLEGWSTSLEAGSADPMIALLLALTPNLRSILLSIPQDSRWPRKILHLAVPQSSTPENDEFTRLREVEFTGWNHSFRFNEILPFFHLPSVRSVLTRGCWDPHGPLELADNRKRDPHLLPIGTSGITKIILEHSRLKPRLLERIVRSCRALESLLISYTFREALFPDLSTPSSYLTVLDPPGIRQALSWAKHSLRSLTLHAAMLVDYEAPFEIFAGLAIKPLGCLQEFEKLSWLDIGLVMLLGNDEDSAPQLPDVLPRSLEILRLRDDHILSYYYWTLEGLVSQLMTIARDDADNDTSLVLVDVSEFNTERFGYESSEFDEDECELEKEFEGSGIELMGWWD